jgi:Tfp pilus assembly ATPase PilU
VDFAHGIPGVARFRISAFRQRGSASLVIRVIPVDIRTIEDLALPWAIKELAEEERGIVLVTGTTGSGKSTTLAAMIDHINATMPKHVVTIEDPIEFLHRDKRSAINQREVGQDTGSFTSALRRILRQDPDVILIGEMRDEETVHTALSPRRPATSCSPPSTPWTPRRPSTASSTSSRRTCTGRCGRCSPGRSRAPSPSAWCRTRPAAAGSRSARCCG